MFRFFDLMLLYTVCALRPLMKLAMNFLVVGDRFVFSSLSISMV